MRSIGRSWAKAGAPSPALQAANSAAAKTKVVAGGFMTSLVCRASAALVICSQRYGLLAD
ncbi:hypothetical protein AXXA_21643 [Achromobacter insuavis AXX-A]|uniref:Uncharacterized protein n=1 Tax=Achromobacter insuavis AXX-A TaxID=1003200 RepID=F7T5V1_9BURK|nr:hypothetical protein AXXA_21643 [Achromobacter insuavis AXX-A]